MPAQSKQVQAFDPDGRILLQVAVEGKIAFIKVSFVRALVRKKAILPRRQELPHGSFVQGEKQLKDFLPEVAIVYGEQVVKPPKHQLWVVSHGWMTAEHPDPTGARLEELIRLLDAYGAKDEDVLFFDYASLPQIDKLHPEYEYNKFLPPGHPALKTPEENESFSKAMRSMDKLYASGAVHVLVMEAIYDVSGLGPHPSGREFTINSRPYAKRGWCAVELTTSNYFGRIINLRDLECQPLTDMDPARFEAEIDAQRVGFTSPGDKTTVLAMFKRYFYAGQVNRVATGLREGEGRQLEDGVKSCLRALEPEVRKVMVSAVCADKTALEDFMDDLIERLSEDLDSAVLEVIGGVLGDFPTEGLAKAAAVLTARAKSDSWWDREAAAEALAEAVAAEGLKSQARTEGVAALVRLTRDVHVGVKKAAASPLACLGASTSLTAEERCRAVQGVLALTSVGDYRVRQAAASPLACLATSLSLPSEERGRAAAVAGLMTLASDKDWKVREAAAPPLACLAAAASLPAEERGQAATGLIALVSDPDPTVRQAALRAPADIGLDEAALNNLVKASTLTLGRTAAAPELPPERRADAAAQLLVGWAQHGQSWKRQAAAAALADVASQALLPPQERDVALVALQKLAEDHERLVREAAASAYGRVTVAGALPQGERASAVAALLVLAKDEQELVRQAVAKALAEAVAAEGLPSQCLAAEVAALVRMAKDLDPDVREAVPPGLARVAANVVLDPWVRGLAAEGLLAIQVGEIGLLKRSSFVKKAAYKAMREAGLDRNDLEDLKRDLQRLKKARRWEWLRPLTRCFRSAPSDKEAGAHREDGDGDAESNPDLAGQSEECRRSWKEAGAHREDGDGDAENNPDLAGQSEEPVASETGQEQGTLPEIPTCTLRKPGTGQLLSDQAALQAQARQEAKEAAAATKLQAMQRGKAARAQAEGMREERRQQEAFVSKQELQTATQPSEASEAEEVEEKREA